MRTLLAFLILAVSSSLAMGASPRPTAPVRTPSVPAIPQPLSAAEITANCNFNLGQLSIQLGQAQYQVVQLQKQIQALTKAVPAPAAPSPPSP